MSTIKATKSSRNKSKNVPKCEKSEVPLSMDLSREITKMFQTNKRKQQRISEYMCELIRKTKCRATKSAESVIRYHPIKRPITSNKFKKFVEKAPYTEMSRFQQKDILSKVQAKGLEDTHKQLLADMMKEVKLEFIKITHYAGMSSKIKTSDGQPKTVIEPYKFQGRTENYQKFLNTRRQFEDKWILHFPIVRKIQKECILNLPHELLSFNVYQTTSLESLECIIKEKVQYVSQLIYEFYKNIVAILNKEELKYSKKHPQQRTYLRACTGILTLHISKSIAHTLTYIVKATSSTYIKPYLALNVSFEGDLILSPNSEDVIKTLWNFLDKIVDTGKEIHVLERYRIKGYENKYITLFLTDEYINNCKNSIKQNIKWHYEPVMEYLNKFSSEFCEIYSDIDSEDFLTTIDDIDFESGCRKISYYRIFLNKVLFIPNHEFFKIGKMHLIEYRENLHQGLNKNISAIFEKLSAQHFWEVNDLCESFDMIKTRAQLKPITTEELIETGNYMAWIRNEHLEILNTRVHDSVISLCRFIDQGILSKKHINMNCKVVHWLSEILPIINEHAVIFDQLKFDSEEKLQKVVEDVGVMIKDVFPLLVIIDEMDDISRVRSYLHAITLHMMKIKEIEKQIIWINTEETTLSFPKSVYSEYEDLKNYVCPFYHLLKLCLDVQRSVSVWQDGSFDKLTYENTDKDVERFHKELTSMYKEYRKKLRQAQDENLPIRFKGTVDDPDILNWPAPLKLCGTALKLIEDFKPSVNVMKIICNPCLKKRHWDAMSEIAGTDITPNAGTTLRKMIQIDFQSRMNEYEIISTGATKEKQIEEELKMLESQWQDMKFLIDENRDLKILKNLDEIEALINDQIIEILVMKCSVFVKANEQNVTDFYNKLLHIKSIVEVWRDVQAKLMKLIQIFTNSNMSDIIPNEYIHFENSIKIYKLLIEMITTTPEVFRIATTLTLHESINLSHNHLEIVHKGIKTYLDTLKNYFTRLHFLSDDELMEIISNKNYIDECQDIFGKIFDAIYRLKIEDQNILGVINYHMENFDFVNKIEKNTKPFERMCFEIHNEIKTSLSILLIKCYKILKKSNFDDVLSNFPVQIIQTVSQIYWTEKIETALDLKYTIKLRIYLHKLNQSIVDKIQLSNKYTTRNYEAAKLQYLIMDDLNLREILGKILKEKATIMNNFDWEAKFKYYYHKGSCKVQALNLETNYEFEYVGIPNSFVLTPATDRCCRTLINAFHLYYNGFITGNTDCGKTETIKYLAGALGIYLKTLTCSKNLQLHTLTQFLTGSVLSGCWLFYENFSCLTEPIMSILSEDFYSILSAKKEGLKQCVIGNKTTSLNPNSFVIASLRVGNFNKIVPQNLKVKFRMVIMLAPDPVRIIEAFLYSYGFNSPSVLAKKLLCTLDMFKNIISNENKYNLSIRTMKKLLTLCYSLKITKSCMDEETILCHSIKTYFGEKVTLDDEKVFMSILKDVFPNYNSFIDTEQNITLKLDKLMTDMNLLIIPNLSTKIANIIEIHSRNENIILIGKLCSGKTSLLKVSKKVMETQENIEIVCNFLNPNSLNHSTLYGYTNNTSHQWQDGVITRILRNGHYQEYFVWMIFDGVLDTIWAEHLTTILEDKQFFLDSGEILHRPERLRLIFEVENINDCSPSLLTRCSIVYMDQASLTWDVLIKSWGTSCKSEWIEGHRDQITDILLWLLRASLEFISEHCKKIYKLDDKILVKTTIHLTQLMLDDVFSSVNHKEEDPRNFSVWIQATLVQSVLISLGSLLDTSSKYKFDEVYKGLWKGLNPDYPYPSSLEKLEVSIPHEGLLFNYHYIYRQRGTWKLNQDLLKTEKISECAYMNEFLVPTTDTTRNSYYLNLLIKYNHPLVFVGSLGKTILIEDTIINKLDENETVSYQLNCSPNITPKSLQKCLLSKLNKGKHGKFSPPPLKKFLLFIDDLNLTYVNERGVFNCLELLRQFLDHGILYQFESGREMFLENINIIGTVGIIEARRKTLPSRFLRHFAVLGTNEFSDEIITKIFSSSLLHKWKKRNFPSDIVSVINQIVDATLNIYKFVQIQYKPTLSKSYYHFGLDSFSKVIQGCSLLRKESYDANKRIYVNLWAHELLRVFGDRLTPLDNKFLRSKMKNCFSDIFGEEENIDGSDQDMNDTLFSNFQIKECNTRRYEEISDLKTLTDSLLDFVGKYNHTHKKKLELVFFTYAIHKLMALCRILSLSPGNAILIGLPGTGRQALTKFAAFIYNCKLFQPNITQDYNLEKWNSEIKIIMKEAGALENQCVFLIKEEQLLEHTYMQNIDYLIRNGEVPGIYTNDEMQEILELTRLSAQGGNKNIDISASTVFLYFHKSCRQNLHIILSLSFNNNLFRNILINYPSLLKCHVISWVDWPDDAYKLISNRFMEKLNIFADKKDILINTSLYIHRHAQTSEKQDFKKNKLKVQVTSSSFVHFIEIFSEFMFKKEKEISLKIDRYVEGLTKLSYAATQIENMQIALARYQPQLAEMTAKASEMTDQIALETIEVEKASALVRKDETTAGEQAIVAQRLKSECESELAQAIPILEDAISALNTLKPSDITLVKSMKNPPDAIKLVMAAVCVIKDVKPDRIPDPSTGRKIIDYWSPSKRILGDMNFLQSLKDFDKDHIKPEIMVKIRKEYLPHKDFKPHVVAKASSAAEGLCKWIIAMDMYDKVAKEVAPKKVKLEKAEKEFSETVAILNQKKEEVARIEEKLASLNALLEDAMRKQMKLQQEVDSCNRKLSSAQKLIDSLGGEKVRWSESVRNLENQKNFLPGNLILSSSIIAYLSHFDSESRSKSIKNWLCHVLENDLTCSQDFDIIKSISTENKMENWLKHGLPNDEFFIQNLVIKQSSKLRSILIDPDYLAKDWITNTECRNNLTLTKFTTKGYDEKLKHCMKYGKPILIHEIKETFPSSLELFTFKNNVEGNNSIKINNEIIIIHPNFRLYLISNLRTPKFQSEIYKQFCLINFGATRTGLEDEMLKIITEIEKPELRKLRLELFRRKSKNRNELSELESKILRTLCESQTDILEDEASIKILDQSKDLARIVREKQKDTIEIEATFNKYRATYEEAGRSSTNLYFCINKLYIINHIYQYSLTTFKDIFQRAILRSEKYLNKEERCKCILKTFTYDLYRYISQSLFDKDKLIFLFLLTMTMMNNQQENFYEDIVLFLRNDYHHIEMALTNPAPDWLKDETWRGICKLGNLKIFKNFLNSFVTNINNWKTVLQTDQLIVNINLPGTLIFTNFHKLILAKVFTPKRMYHNLVAFIRRELGDEYLKGLSFHPIDTYNESNSLCPILFISVPSSNIRETVENLSAKKMVKHTFRSFSVGYNDLEQVSDVIDAATRNGSWVLLENCHFSQGCFLMLESKLDDMNFENTHENFRLWLTIEATQFIPLELLQKCMKIVDENSINLKSNFLRLYNKEPINDTNFFQSCPGKQTILAKLLYGLIFFHCTLIRRAMFPQFNWRSSYIFDQSDFSISIRQLVLTINESTFTVQNLQKLYYMIGNCHYMNYMDNDQDNNFLETLLINFVNSDIFHSKHYRFSGLENYIFPKKMDHCDFVSQINNFPCDDYPPIFGFNSSIDNTFKQNIYEDITKRTLAVLDTPHPKNIEDNEFSLLNSVDDLRNKLPSTLKPVLSGNYVLQKEIKKYNKFLFNILESLSILKDCISGSTAISSDYTELAADILRKRTPKIWKYTVFSSETNLGHFITDLKEKVSYLQNFNEAENRLWLGAFHSPKSLICQFKIDYSRNLKIPLQDISLSYEVIKNDSLSENTKPILIGISLLGANWDEKNGIICENFKSLYANLPPVAVLAKSTNENCVGKNISCTLYKNSKQEYIVEVISLPTDTEQEYWIRRGIKLFCQKISRDED